MKKLIGIFISIFMFSVFTTCVSADDTVSANGYEFKRNRYTWYFVEDKLIDFNSNGIYTDTLVTEIGTGSVNLMPIRAFSESIGAELKQEEGIWYVIADEYAIDFYAGDDFINIYRMEDGNMVFLVTWHLDCPVIENKGVTYIPFRSAICALFGVSENEIYTTDKIAVEQYEEGYAIFAARSGAPEHVDLNEVAHTVTLVKPDGEEVRVSVAKKEYMVNISNFRKFIGNQLFGGDIYSLDEIAVRRSVYEHDFLIVNTTAKKFEENIDDIEFIMRKEDAVEVKAEPGAYILMYEKDLNDDLWYAKRIDKDFELLQDNIYWVQGIPEDGEYEAVAVEDALITVYIGYEDFPMVFTRGKDDRALLKIWGDESKLIRVEEEAVIRVYYGEENDMDCDAISGDNPQLFLLSSEEHHLYSNEDDDYIDEQGEYDLGDGITVIDADEFWENAE